MNKQGERPPLVHPKAKNEQDRVRYISEVYNTIVNRDLVKKYNLPDTYVLDRLAEYLMDNISNLTSPNKVSDNIDNPDTFKREYEPLLKIADAHPKMILANTKHDEYSYEGIRGIDIARWLKLE